MWSRLKEGRTGSSGATWTGVCGSTPFIASQQQHSAEEIPRAQEKDKLPVKEAAAGYMTCRGGIFENRKGCLHGKVLHTMGRTR